MTPQNKGKPSRAERTAEAREKARKIREEQQKKEKRNRLLVRWGVVAGIVAIIAIIAIIVMQNVRGQIPDEGPTAANTNEYGGIVIGADNEVLTNAPAGNISADDLPDEAPQPEGEGPLVPPGIEPSEEDEPVNVVLFEDFQCPICKQFEETFGGQLQELQNEGDITVEYRIISILDRATTTNYASRAANAAKCVADESPENYTAYSNALFENQPPEDGGEGLSNERLTEMASEVGAEGLGDCIDSTKFRPAVEIQTERAGMYGVDGTPTAFVDGEKWNPQEVPSFIDFVEQKLQAKQ
ncbi:DsbA family protein [Arthrobacter monumenti]